MSKKVYLILFCALALVQWLVPLNMIRESEITLNEGDEYKFRLRPVDPSDPFRGKYITLYFEDNTVSLPDTTFRDNDEVYVIIERDENGFAQPVDITHYPDEADPRQIMSATIRYTGVPTGGKATLNYPFEKFFLEESKAPEAERIYWQNRSDSTQVAYAIVMINKAGNPVLKDVMINERSIIDIIREMNEPDE